MQKDFLCKSFAREQMHITQFGVQYFQCTKDKPVIICKPSQKVLKSFFNKLAKSDRRKIRGQQIQ